MAMNSTATSQWVCNVVNVESKSEANMAYLMSILGPLKSNPQSYAKEDEAAYASPNISDDENTHHDIGSFTHSIIFKIEEPVFIDTVNIYEKVTSASSVLKIEAQAYGADEWFTCWEATQGSNIVPTQNCIYTPTITRTPFKSDTIKLTLNGSMQLIDAVEVKGNKMAVDESGDATTQTPITNAFDNYGLLSRHLRSLVLNDLFADVFFEVDGKTLPAHRNILVARSEYFRAMLNSQFKEAREENRNNHSPIYIPDISYEVFLQVLTYLYTGHLDEDALPYHLILGVMRAADLMNICALEALCLRHLSDFMSADNVVQIFVEANASSPVLQSVCQMCYDTMAPIFSHVSKNEHFCALPQQLMLMIIENVVPSLTRLTSQHIENAERQQQQPGTNSINGPGVYIQDQNQRRFPVDEDSSEDDD